jgi:hypothetical protein
MLQNHSPMVLYTFLIVCLDTKNIEKTIKKRVYNTDTNMKKKKKTPPSLL